MPDPVDQPDDSPSPDPAPAPKPRRKFASRITAVLCVLYALGAITVWLLFHYLGESWWPVTFLMFSPRWIWGVPLPLVLLLSAIFRPRAIFLPFFTAVLVLIGLMGFSIPWRAAITPARGSHTVRLVTANLHAHQADPKIVNDFLVATHPDVVTFQVFDPKTDIPYLHQTGWHVMQTSGLMVASRWPVSLIQNSSMGEPPETPDEIQGGMTIDGAAGRYTVHAPFGDFQVVGLHLTSPHHAISNLRRQGSLAAHLLSANSVRRTNSSRALAAAVRQTPGPVILAGDFNTTEDSPIFRDAWAPYTDAFSAAGFGFGTSYSQHRTWLRIDHILYDPSWQCHTTYTSPDTGSGHRAVFAELTR